MGDRVRRHVFVRGQVHGVWFRESTRREAERAGVAGWVRNLSDDTVEAALEGSAEAVEQVLAFCRIGPPAAQVTQVDVHDEPTEDEAFFHILPTPEDS